MIMSKTFNSHESFGEEKSARFDDALIYNILSVLFLSLSLSSKDATTSAEVKDDDKIANRTSNSVRCVLFEEWRSRKRKGWLTNNARADEKEIIAAR